MKSSERTKVIQQVIDFELNRKRHTNPNAIIEFPITRYNPVVAMASYESQTFGLDNQCGVSRTKQILNPDGETRDHVPYGSIFIITKPNQFHRFSVHSGRELFVTTLDPALTFKLVLHHIVFDDYINIYNIDL